MMMLGLSLMACACVGAFFNWRSTLLFCVVVGLIQDPLRKLTPGAPVFFVGFVAAALAAGWLGAMTARVRLTPTVIYGWTKGLAAPFSLFCIVLVAQALLSYYRFQNIFFPLIGGVFYIAPIVAIVFAHQIAVKIGTAGVRKWMWFYVACSLVWFISIYLDASGVRLPVLGEVGVGQIIYDVGSPSKANAGFYRAAEIAAWHVATVSCFLFILLNGRKLSVFKSLCVIAVVIFLLYIGLSTGRRKMLVQVVIFASVFLFFFAWFLKGKAKLAMVTAIFAAVGISTVMAVLEPEGADADPRAPARTAQVANSQFDAWKNRGLTVFESIPERFHQLGYLPVISAVRDFGIFGAGLGAGGQGLQHFGGGMKLVGGTAEGGLGKLTLDLGLGGLAIFIWLGFVVLKLIWQRLAVLAQTSRPHASLAFGFTAILVANVATFSVATQAYGDVFILIILGTSIGVILALPAIAANELGITQAIANAARGIAPEQPAPLQPPPGAPVNVASQPLNAAQKSLGA